MSKFIVKSCSNIMSSYYADGRTAHHECGRSTIDELCCDVKDCPIKQVVENLLKVIKADVCSRCDGCGYDNGCADDGCGTYVANECLELLDVEFLGGE